MIRFAALLATVLTLVACASTPSSNESSAIAAGGPVETKPPIEPIGAPSMIYVADFQALAKSTSSEGQIRLRPGLLQSARSELSQSQFCGRLANAVVSELRQRGFRAEHAPSGATASSGWLVQGAFVEEQSSSGVLAQRFAPTSIDMFVRIEDLERGAPQPVGSFNLSGDRSGEGVPFVPNPYAAAAKFVVRQSELSGDAQALAKRVADEVVRFAQSEHVKRTAATR